MRKILIIFILFGLTGCWNYRELNQLAITSGVGIDKKDDMFEITIMIANSKKPGSDSGGSQPSTTVYSGVGKTIYEAFKNTSLAVSKQIYLGHIDVLVLSESILKNDTKTVTDFLFRYPQTRNDFLLVIAKDSKASDILTISTPLESFPSQNIARNLEITNRLQGITYTVDFNQFIKATVEEGINPILPSVYIVGDAIEGNKDKNIKQNKPETYLKLGTVGLFKESNLIAFASDDESRGINIINNKVDLFGVTIDLNEIKIVTEITSMNTKNSIKDNKVTIEVSAQGGVQEISNQIDLTDPKIMNEIKSKNEEEIKNLINQGIDVARKNKTDVFGFGKILHKKDFKKWNEVKLKWDDTYFLQLEIEIKVDLKLENKGTVTNNIEVKK